MMGLSPIHSGLPPRLIYFFDVEERRCVRESSDMVINARVFDSLEECEAYCSVGHNSTCPPVVCPADCAVSVIQVSCACVSYTV